MLQSDETSVVDEKVSQSPMKGSLLIPSIALGYVPFVFLFLFLNPDDGCCGNYIFIVNNLLCLFILLPLYAIYLVWLGRQRFKDGTLTWFDAIFHIVSFIVPLGFFVLFSLLTSMGSPA